MANKYFSGEKASKIEAERSLRQHVAGVCDLRFTVRFEQDDGGSHICLYVEVENPSDPLDAPLVEALHFSKWEGWRYLIIKCPIGYIDAMIDN